MRINYRNKSEYMVVALLLALLLCLSGCEEHARYTNQAEVMENHTEGHAKDKMGYIEGGLYRGYNKIC